MFREWGFLLGEIWFLLALAALLGLLAGWLIFGRRSTTVVNSAEADQLRADLAACRRDGKACADQLAAARQRLSECEAGRAEAEAALKDTPAPAAFAAAPAAPAAVDAEGFVAVGRRPAALAAARNGQPDDLKLISGVGPVLEKLCHSLGFYHFDQVAAWTAEEIAWVDENLEGFKGRVTRDDWVGQARLLAQGNMPQK
ncbi:hypothetical protein ACEYYB_08520 [Paracoccus sp. p4-l81]|uniref:hypothetical protein n=1 Tax=Paracoccus sp. p4-l81 TaxID=3342806 RepID=UPI0035B97505